MSEPTPDLRLLSSGNQEGLFFGLQVVGNQRFFGHNAQCATLGIHPASNCATAGHRSQDPAMLITPGVPHIA